jgi:hypothetical protein
VSRYIEVPLKQIGQDLGIVKSGDFSPAIFLAGELPFRPLGVSVYNPSHDHLVV